MIWSVRTDQEIHSQWSTEALEALGGRGVLARGWHTAKDMIQMLTGRGKRQAEDSSEVVAHSKRLREEPTSSTASSNHKGTSFVSPIPKKPLL